SSRLLTAGPEELGRLVSRRNALKDGCSSPGVLLPEDEAEAILERAESWRPHVRPEGPEQEWEYLHVYIPESFRVERCHRVEGEILTERAVRASAYWELDRRGAADELGSRLARDPSRVRSQLLQFKQGCQWLLERLEKLAAVLEAGKDWDAVQHRL